MRRVLRAAAVGEWSVRERFTISARNRPSRPPPQPGWPTACRTSFAAAAVAIKGQGLDGTHPLRWRRRAATAHCGGACGILPGATAPARSAADEVRPELAAETHARRGVLLGSGSGGSSAPAGGSSKPVVSAATALPMLW